MHGAMVKILNCYVICVLGFSVIIIVVWHLQLTYSTFMIPKTSALP